MNGTKLNTYDWITTGLGVLTVVISLIGVVTGNKAQEIRLNQQVEEFNRLTSKTT